MTIGTKNRKKYFGDVIETQHSVSPQETQLSEIVTIANQNWLVIPEHFPFVKLGNHVSMPNHMHGIIIIEKPIDFVWQPIFQEHIIRSEKALHIISEYIFNTPMHWKKDTSHK